jgi:histidine ammonia-lyase
MAVHEISDKPLTQENLSAITFHDVKIKLSESARDKIIHCREYLDKELNESDEAIYGINTGFGSLYNKNISSNQLEKLQENLVKSHACGTGPEVHDEIVRMMLFLKVQSLY